jgi:hypothetical protein
MSFNELLSLHIWRALIVKPSCNSLLHAGPAWGKMVLRTCVFHRNLVVLFWYIATVASLEHNLLNTHCIRKAVCYVVLSRFDPR